MGIRIQKEENYISSNVKILQARKLEQPKKVEAS
jgi:hypothetical protein